MAEQNEIIAVFRADIEQFKKDVAEAGVVTGSLDKKVESVSTTTQKFEKNTKGAAGSISTLSKGLGGITGLLGITGRLFGVNTDKLEGFIFASREFIKVARDVQHAQHLSNLATEEGTVAKAANETATVSLTVAERVLNAVRSAGALGVGLVIAGIVAIGAAIANYVQGLDEEEKALKRKKDIDKEQIKINEELAKSFNERAKTQDETALAEGVRTGLVTERQAKEIELNKRFFEQAAKDEKEINDQRFKASLAGQNAFGQLSASDQQRIEANRIKLEKANESTLQADLASLREKFAKEDAESKKKEDEKSLAEKEASLQKEFAAFVKYWDDVDKKNRDAQKAILKEQELFAANKQKLIEDEFSAEQDAFVKNQKIAFDASLKNLELLRALKEANALTPEQAKALEGLEKDINDKRIKAAQKTADIIFKAQQEGFDKRQELLSQEITDQQANIETQRRLAENGLSNTLAFEEKRAADLRRQQQVEAERQKRVKLLETFLNSLAEFSKDDPKNALSKALLQVALAQAASAVFAEDGGIIGEIGARSNLSRRHKGGGDVLLHAQTGEGILSRREMDNLGKRNFHLLKDAARFPIRDDVFGMPKIALAGGVAMSNAEVVKELQALRKDIRNQPRESWEVNKFGEYIKTSIENGVTEVTKGKMPKPRFK